jgi:hypothetical protein
VTAATTDVAVSPAAVFGAIGVMLSASGSEKAKRFGRVASVAMVKKW